MTHRLAAGYSLLNIQHPRSYVVPKSVLVLFLLYLLCRCELSAKQGHLSSYHVENKHPSMVEVPTELKEISGIAVDEKGRLFAHGDEYGTIYQLSPETGIIIKNFSIGNGTPLHADFEDIAIVDATFYLVTSKGKLFEFHEGANNAVVKYTEYTTGLKRRFNVEGLCVDPTMKTLLITCKYLSAKDNDDRPIYSFSLKDKTLEGQPRFVISLSKLKKKFGVHKFRPTAITRDPQTGNFFILSSHIPAVIEISPIGDIIDCEKLPGDIHQQPEGIAFLPDRSLLISDEGKVKGRVVTYPLNK